MTKHAQFTYKIKSKVELQDFSCFNLSTRPKHITLVNFASRSEAKIRFLKFLGLSKVTRSDSFVTMYKDCKDQSKELLQTLSDGTVKYQQWKCVKLPNGKERMRIVHTHLPKTEFNVQEEILAHFGIISETLQLAKIMYP